MKTSRLSFATLAVIFVAQVFGLMPVKAAPTHELLASFDRPIQDPGSGSLVLGPDGYFWGTAENGGVYGVGSIYKVKADGSGWTTVLSFNRNGATNKGANPIAGLVSDGAGYLWGTTNQGGASNYGTVYKVNASTGALTTVVEFSSNGATNKGAYPYASLVSDGAGNFWGTTQAGGASGNGTIYKINASTGALTTVVDFRYDGVTNKGAYPMAGLVSDGAGSFWGTTSQPSASSYGTVFKVNETTGALTTVVEFSDHWVINKGRNPRAGLVSDGAGFFWGTTQGGGANDCGTVFKINASTGALTTVVEFSFNGTTNKGAYPYAGLVSDGVGSFWGTTKQGGVSGNGTVFKINTTTGVLTTVVEFSSNGATNKGPNPASPNAGLVSDGAGSFWGTTQGGGASNNGTVFKVNATTGALTAVVEFSDSGAINKGAAPYAGSVSDGAGSFWGTTFSGGVSSYGTVYKFNSSTGALSTVVEFSNNGATNRGAYPYAGLVSDGAGSFWGTTYRGGANDYGTVFRINAATGTLTTVVEFSYSGASNKGAYPYAGLVSDGAGYFWGTTYAGGAGNGGTVFKINATTGALTTVVEFSNNGTNNNGVYPYAGLVSDGAGYFWGTTHNGGANDYGTVFKINAATGVLSTVAEFSFNGAINKGAYPYAGLVSDGEGYFWGTTNQGGASGYGTVFKIDATTGALTTVVEFSSNGSTNKGAAPYAGLVSDGAGFFWGTTFNGGASNYGTVYKLNSSTGVLSTVLEFTGTGSQANNGANPGYGSLFRGTDGNFYGTTVEGGPGGAGTVFRLRLGPTPVTQPAGGITPSGVVLNGTVNPNNDGATAASFQYGTSPTLSGAATVSAGTVPNGGAASAVSATLTGLSPNKTYYYRLLASNAGNSITQQGEIVSFTSRSNSAPVAPNGTAIATSGDAKTITLPFPTTDTDGDAVTLTSVTPGSGLTVNSFSGSNVTFAPVYGFTGTSSLSYTVEDGFGGTATGTITVTVERGEPVTRQLFTKGAAVLGAGVPGSGVPTGATWNNFGVPSINGAGELAFVASLKLSPSGTLTGIFAGSAEAPALLVKTGDAAPGANGAVFASFKDPLFNEAGRVAFMATISGAGVTAANNSGIWTNAFGTDAAVFQLVAKKGGTVPGVERARWKSFSSVALASGELNLVGAMASGAGGVSVTNDLVLCRYGAGASDGELLLREGQQLSIDGATGKLKSFAALATVSGSPGQRRQPLAGGLHVKATLSDGRMCLLNNIGSAGLSQLEAVMGDVVMNQNSQPAGTLASLGLVADASGSGWASVFRAALKGAGTSAADNSALVGASADGLTILARKGEEADVLRTPGALIKTFASEPVASEKGYSAVVTLSGEGISKPSDTALLWRGNGFSGILAREGDPAPGAGGALYGSFVSVALPNGAAGPIFVAKLLSAKPAPAGRVTARNDLGLWATDTSGAVRLLLREGDALDGNAVSSFDVLPVVLGSAAQARSYNDTGTIAVKVIFSDKTQAVVQIRVP